MNPSAAGAPLYQLPPEIKEFRELARRLVHEELLPLEQEYLRSPEQAYGLQPMTNLRAVFPADVVKRLEKIARDTGLWYVMVPEEHGGMGLSLLARVAIIEEFMYTAVPFPWVNVPNILYECRGEQVERFLKPVIEGQKIRCFAQTEPNAGSDPGGMMKTSAVWNGSQWVINGTKMWISGASESDVILVQAVTDPEKWSKERVTFGKPIAERQAIQPTVCNRSSPRGGRQRRR